MPILHQNITPFKLEPQVLSHKYQCQKSCCNVIAAAFDGHSYISVRKEERIVAATVLASSDIPNVDKEQLLSDLQAALYCAICAGDGYYLSIIIEALMGCGFIIESPSDEFIIRPQLNNSASIIHNDIEYLRD